jgi:hypothetical protein
MPPEALMPELRLQSEILISKRPYRAPSNSLHFAHYNFVRLHKTLRITPAMAAGVSDRLWTLTELVEQTSR